MDFSLRLPIAAAIETEEAAATTAAATTAAATTAAATTAAAATEESALPEAVDEENEVVDTFFVSEETIQSAKYGIYYTPGIGGGVKFFRHGRVFLLPLKK